MTFPLPNHCCIPPPQIEFPSQTPSQWLSPASHQLRPTLQALRCKHLYSSFYFLFTWYFKMKFNSRNIGRAEVACPCCTQCGCTDHLAAGWLFGFLHVCAVSLHFFFACESPTRATSLVFTHFPSFIPANPLLTKGTSPKSHRTLWGTSPKR